MAHAQTLAAEKPGRGEELDLVRRSLDGDGKAFRIIIRRHNQTLYRLARSILRDNGEAEDAVQEAYVRAYAHLAGFRGDCALGTWLSRIVINEALGRLRKRRTAAAALAEAGRAAAQIIPFPQNGGSDDPERSMAQRQILRLVEQATDALPDAFRTVFVARVIEGMSVEETAALLDIRPETVKTRLHRARKLVREQLDRQIGPVLLDAFPFAGTRCDRLTEAVMRRLDLAG